VHVGRAVLRCLEEDRVDKPDERDVGDAVLDLEVGDVLLRLLGEELLLLDRERARAERLGRTGLLADPVDDVLFRGDAQLELVTRREPQLVDPVQVRRVGDGDAEQLVLERVRIAITRSSTCSGTVFTASGATSTRPSSTNGSW